MVMLATAVSAFSPQTSKTSSAAAAAAAKLSVKILSLVGIRQACCYFIKPESGRSPADAGIQLCAQMHSLPSYRFNALSLLLAGLAVLACVLRVTLPYTSEAAAEVG